MSGEGRAEGSRPVRSGFFVSGEGVLARLAMERAVDLGFVTAGVVLDTTASGSLDSWCKRQSVPYLRLSSPLREHWVPLVGEFLDRCGDSYWMLTFSRILPASLLHSRKGRILNVHEALLPAFRGLAPLTQAVEHGVRFAGATIHEVTEDVDAGPIVAQCVVAVHPDDSASDVGQRLFTNLPPMYLQVVRWIAEGRLVWGGSSRLQVRDASYGGASWSPQIEEYVFRCLETQPEILSPHEI